MSSVVSGPSRCRCFALPGRYVNEKNKAEETIIEKIKNLQIPVCWFWTNATCSTLKPVEIKKTEWERSCPELKCSSFAALKAIDTQKLLDRIFFVAARSPPFYDKDVPDRPQTCALLPPRSSERKFLWIITRRSLTRSTSRPHLFVGKTEDRSISGVIHVSRESQKGYPDRRKRGVPSKRWESKPGKT